MAARNSRRFEFKLGKTGMIVFILGLSLVVFFSFIFGVTVGKDIEAYPEKWARGVPTMIKEQLGLMSGQGPQLADKSSRDSKTVKDADKDFGLTFYDTLTGKKVDAEKVGGHHKGDVKSSVDNTKQQARTDVNVMPPNAEELSTEKVDKSVASVSSPGNVLNKAMSSSGADNVSKQDLIKGSSKYLIQVVSFQERNKADGISKKLMALGYKPRIVAADIPGKGKWFRVVLTGFDSRQDAQNISAAIMKKVNGIHCVVLTD